MQEQQSAPGVDWLSVSELPSDETGDPEVTETEDESPAADEQELSEPDATEEVLVSDDDTDKIEEQAETADIPDAFDWDGDPEKLPPALEYEGVLYDLRATHKSMLAGHNKKSQRLSEKDRQQAAELDGIREENTRLRNYVEAVQAGQSDLAPQRPTTDDPAEWEKFREDYNRWTVRDENRKTTMPVVPEAPAQAAPMTPEAVQTVVARRMSLLASQPKWSDEVSMEMQKIAESDPRWQAQIMAENPSDDGTILLYQHAIESLERESYKKTAADNETKSVRRVARAPRNAVSRATSASGKNAAENYSNTTWDNVAD